MFPDIRHFMCSLRSPYLISNLCICLIRYLIFVYRYQSVKLIFGRSDSFLVIWFVWREKKILICLLSFKNISSSLAILHVPFCKKISSESIIVVNSHILSYNNYSFVQYIKVSEITLWSLFHVRDLVHLDFQWIQKTDSLIIIQNWFII